MYPELTNLLPSDRVEALRQDYLVRLGIVLGALLAALIVIAGVMLIPTYAYLYVEVASQTTQLAAIEASSAAANEAALTARLGALSKDANQLGALAKASSASVIIPETLQVSRTGIRISGFSFTPSSDGKAGTLVLDGTADTRDYLRAYQLALLASPFVKAADLPISAYAKDSNIAFTITVTLAQKP